MLFLPFTVAKVGFEDLDYQLVEGQMTSVCIAFEGTLEKPIFVNYTFTDMTIFGKHELDETMDAVSILGQLGWAENKGSLEVLPIQKI